MFLWANTKAWLSTQHGSLTFKPCVKITFQDFIHLVYIVPRWLNSIQNALFKLKCVVNRIALKQWHGDNQKTLMILFTMAK